jgi:RNA polymerase sigma-70 factor (ECF subfamily)
MKGFKKDRKLWKKILAGDEKAFADLYDLYVDKIYRFVFLKTNNRLKTEEMVQDIFLKLWRAGQKESEEEVNAGKRADDFNVRAYLYRIARHTVIDFYRSDDKAGRKSDIVSLDDLQPEMADENLFTGGQTAENQALDDKYALEEVKEALEKLPDNYKEIIVMKFVDELTHKEIAEVLGKTEGNVRILAHRALNKLRQILKKE